MDLILFDFDGTITKRDSFGLFIFRSINKTRKYFTGVLILMPLLILYLTGLIGIKRFKELVLILLFKNKSINYFNGVCKEFSDNVLHKIINPRALVYLNKHKENGDYVMVVTASYHNYMKYWCDYHKVGLIASEIELVNNKLTGKLLTHCNNGEKARLIKKHIDLGAYNNIIAYGNSKADIEMLSLATKKYYKYF